MADGKDDPKDKAAEPARQKPKTVTEALPTSLQIAGWTIPLVIGLVGLVKTVADMSIAAQNELRSRATAEISFYDKQFEMAAKADDKQANTAAVLSLGVKAMLNRPKPDLCLGPVFDWALRTPREKAYKQICASRQTALSLYSSDGFNKAASERYIGLTREYAALAAIQEKAQAADAALRPKTDPIAQAQHWPNTWLGCPDPAREIAVNDDGSPARSEIGRLVAWDRQCATQGAQAPTTQAAANPPPPVGKPAIPNPAVPAMAPKPPPAAYAATSGVGAGARRQATAALRGPLVDCAVVPESASDPKLTVAQAGDRNAGWDVDIFWCGSKDRQVEIRNFTAACQAFNNLAKVDTVGAQGERLGRQRLSRLAVATRAGGGYNVQGNEVRYDVGDLAEQLVANAVGGVAMPGGYSLKASHSGTRWYISAFTCPAG